LAWRLWLWNWNLR